MRAPSIEAAQTAWWRLLRRRVPRRTASRTVILDGQDDTGLMLLLRPLAPFDRERSLIPVSPVWAADATHGRVAS